MVKKEKRKESRKKEEMKVTVTLISGDKPSLTKESFCTLTKDVSLGGMRIITKEELPLHTTVKLEIALTKPRKMVKLTGKVVWVNKAFNDELFEVGLEFLDPDPKTVIALLEHMYGKK